MYIDSDNKVRNAPVRISKINQGMSAFHEVSHRQTINFGLEKKSVLIESNSWYSKNNRETTLKLKKNVSSITKYKLPGKTLKNSSSSMNINKYPESYRNWVSGIKLFSATMSEKKWKMNKTAIKLKRDNDANTNNFYKKSLLFIENNDRTNKNEMKLNRGEYNHLSNFPNRNPHEAMLKSFNDIGNKDTINVPMIKNIRVQEDICIDNTPKSLKGFNNINPSNRFGDKFARTSDFNLSMIHLKNKRKIKRLTIRSSDATKIVFSKVNQNENKRNKSFNSSNHSLNDEKKEEIMNNITKKPLSPSNKISVNLESKLKISTDIIKDLNVNNIARKVNSRLSDSKIDASDKSQSNDNRLANNINKIKGAFDFVYPSIVMKKAELITNKLKTAKGRVLNIKNLKQPQQEEKKISNLPIHIENFKIKNFITMDKQNTSVSLHMNKTSNCTNQFYSLKKSLSTIQISGIKDTVILPHN